MDVVTLGPAGRIVLPAQLRRELGLRLGTKLLALRVGDRLVLQTLDTDAVARAIAAELGDLDRDTVAQSLAEDAQRDAAATLAAILAGHKPARGGHPARSTGDRKPTRTPPRARQG